MTTRFVKYSLTERLPCANASRKEVILCLQDAALIVQPDPACASGITTIDAEICQAYTLCDSCTRIVWNYTFSYDDTQLTNPTTPLIPGDIVGVFCKDCLTDWFEQQLSCIISEGTCVTDTNTIDLTLYEGCISGEVKLSEDAGNELEIHDDGLYSPEGIICVTDTDSVDLTIYEGCVSADVNISADAGNIIELRADGLFAEGGGGGDGWALLGNAGTVEGTNFLGTTDSKDLEFRINNQGVYLFQKPFSYIDGTPSIIANSAFNIVETDTFGNFDGNGILSGGGVAANANEIITSIALQASQNVIAGGFSNIIDSGYGCNILGGYTHFIFSADGSGVGSGVANYLGWDGGVVFEASLQDWIGGGVFNRIWHSTYCTIGGGADNTIYSNLAGTVDSATIAGGEDTTILNGDYSSIGGGQSITITGSRSACPGGAALRLGSNSFGFQGYEGSITQRDVSAFSQVAYFGDVDLWVGNSDSTARKLKLFEPNADLDFSSTHYSSLQSQAQAANIEYVLPAAAGIVGNYLKIQGIAGNIVTLEWGA